MKKNKKMFFCWLFWSVFSISCMICFIGVIQLYHIQQMSDKGVVLYESSINNPDQTPPNSQDEQEGYITSEVQGLLVFDDQHKVAIFEGITPNSLLYGAGRVQNSAYPNTIGNCLLLGHRDSVFRILKNLEIKDTFTLLTKQKTIRYQIESIKIVEDGDPSLYAQTNSIKVTLVTCYPFTYYGPALQRYVIEAYAL